MSILKNIEQTLSLLYSNTKTLMLYIYDCNKESQHNTYPIYWFSTVNRRLKRDLKCKAFIWEGGGTVHLIWTWLVWPWWTLTGLAWQQWSQIIIFASKDVWGNYVRGAFRILGLLGHLFLFPLLVEMFVFGAFW